MDYRPLAAILKSGRLAVRLVPTLALAAALGGLAGPGCGGGAEGDQQAATATAAADSAGGADAWPELSAAHILIRYQGSRGAPPDLRRTRAEAEELALRLADRARSGEEFEQLALQYSEEPGVERTAGHLGNFLPTEMDVGFVAALLGIREGEVTVHESEYGFHVVERLPTQRVLARHILIAWRGAEKASETVTRTEPQAATLAVEVARMAAAPDADLCELARKFSDDPESRIQCGLLGVLERGTAPPEVERALFRLRPGQVSEPVRSQYGWHILWRER